MASLSLVIQSLLTTHQNFASFVLLFKLHLQKINPGRNIKKSNPTLFQTMQIGIGRGERGDIDLLEAALNRKAVIESLINYPTNEWINQSVDRSSRAKDSMQNQKAKMYLLVLIQSFMLEIKLQDLLVSNSRRVALRFDLVLVDFQITKEKKRIAT